MTRQPQWEPTAPIPPVFDHIEPQTPAPRSTMPATPPSGQDVSPTRNIPPVADKPTTPPLEQPVGTIKPADDEPQLAESVVSNPGANLIALDTIKAAIKSRADEAARQVANLRKERDQWNIAAIQQRNRLNARIKVAVAELAEAKRIANSLTPRKPRTKKAPK